MSPIIKLHSSRILLRSLILFHAGIALGLTLTSFPNLLIFAFILLILFSFIYCYRRYILFRSALAICAIARQDNAWQLFDPTQNSHAASLVRPIFNHQYLTILNFRLLNSRRICSILILPDTLSAETYRQLQWSLKNHNNLASTT